MGIKICGHEVRMKKPIKIYTLLKTSSLVLMIGTISLPPALAAESTRPNFKQASTCVTATCPSFQEDCMAAPAMIDTPRHRAQRTAGTDTATMSPALALAMALGLRMAQGPLEHTPRVAVRSE